MDFLLSKPVWAKGCDGKRNILLDFSATLEFGGEKVEIAVAADAVYQLYINGSFVMHGPQRSGKGFWRRDEFDIGESLKIGKNEISIKVLRYGVESFEFCLQNSFLQAEVFKNGKTALATGRDFVCRRDLSREQVVERYSFQRPFIEVKHFPAAYSEELCAKEVENIITLPRTAPYPKFKKLYPDTLVAVGKANIPDNGEDPHYDNYERGDLPDFSHSRDEFNVLFRAVAKDTENTEYNEKQQSIKNDYTVNLSSGEWQLLKFPFEDTGFITCRIECSENSLIRFDFDEILTDGDVNFMKRYGSTCNTQPVYLKKGKYDFTAIDPKSMQYIKVLCKSGSVKINGLCLTEYTNSSPTAVFECDDEALMRVYNAAVNTFCQNSVDVYMDCPSRERAGWLCDSFFTARAEKDLTGASNVEKGFLENFLFASDFPRLPQGMLPMCYPSDPISSMFIPNWAMFFVTELEEYYYRTGDRKTVDLAKERVYSLEKYFTKFINADGLLQNLEGWVFVEWSKANEWCQDVSFPSNMMYYAMLKSAARLYDDEQLDKKAEKTKTKIRELSYNGKFFRDHQVLRDGTLSTPEDITEVCQYYAFFTGVANKESYPQLLKIIAEDFGAGHKCEKTHRAFTPQMRSSATF